MKKSFLYWLIIFSMIYILTYAVIYQYDYYVFLLSDKNWIKAEAEIIKINAIEYRVRHRREKTIISRKAMITYNIADEEYNAEVLISFDEMQAELIDIVVNKEDVHEVRRCEWIWPEESTQFMLRFFAIVLAICIPVNIISGIYMQKRKKDDRVIQITKEIE